MNSSATDADMNLKIWSVCETLKKAKLNAQTAVVKMCEGNFRFSQPDLQVGRQGKVHLVVRQGEGFDFAPAVCRG